MRKKKLKIQSLISTSLLPPSSRQLAAHSTAAMAKLPFYLISKCNMNGGGQFKSPEIVYLKKNFIISSLKQNSPSNHTLKLARITMPQRKGSSLHEIKTYSIM